MDIYHPNFVINKYYKTYINLVEKRKLEILVKTKTQYVENHHIIPKSMGGDNNRSNRINVTAREHFVLHKLFKSGFWVTNGVNNKRVQSVDDIELGYVVGWTTIVKSDVEIAKKKKQFLGFANPKAKTIHIFDADDNLKYECLGNFKIVCKSNNLPQSQLVHSYSNNGDKILLNKSPTNKVLLRWINFVGWYAKIIA